MKQVCRNHLNNMRQNRGDLDNADGGGWDCDYRRVDWEGESEIVSGSLSGTVTIDLITPTVITGTFDLDGQGTRHVTEHRIEGRDSERAIGSAPLRASGSFRAGNGRPGLYRINHSSVRVE